MCPRLTDHYSLSDHYINEALEKYPHPEIFNTDQGSQYTSEIHTQRLKNLGITISMDGRGEPQIISALSASGEAPKLRESI
jgi:transposase InsO family protein